MHKAVGLIPCRLNSRRLPKKPIIKVENLPLIIHTYRRAKLAKKLKEVFICCDSEEVMDLAKKYNAKAILTSKNHKCGTDRIYEGYLKSKINYDQIIDIQGDETLIDPKNIDKVVEYHRKNKYSDIILPNLITKNKNDSNIVKVIFNKKKEVIYLTRSNSPHPFRKKIDKIFKHLSVISFKPTALKKFSKNGRSKLEIIEDIELLRAIDLGLKIKTFSLKGESFSIDVLKNLKDFRRKIKFDKYYNIYSKK
tara:strand:+ start:164 stop:916 length:753 start_codon:yes stop_codon:yes gene_type:complete